MKKVLLLGTALVGFAALATPAQADLQLGLKGYSRMYGVNADSDIAGIRENEFRHNNEVHFTGETTLDNGLTVGVHNEVVLGNDTAGMNTDETYVYFSGGWGRINAGVEDGAAFLLQVAAPSADSNVDGMRVFIQGINAAALGAGLTNGAGAPHADYTALRSNGRLDYDHADFRQAERMTYMTPKWNGFQAGVSYAPDSVVDVSGTGNTAGMPADAVNTHEDLWELAARWDGEFEGVGISAGVGYSDSDIQTITVVEDQARDGLTTWNTGLNFTWQNFSLGGGYKHSETSALAINGGNPDTVEDLELTDWVVGLGYKNGPYAVGASYLNQEWEGTSRAAGTPTAAAGKPEDDKFAVGGSYTYGPGMSFRGSVAWGEFDRTDVLAGGADNDFQQIAIGTDIKF